MKKTTIIQGNSNETMQQGDVIIRPIAALPEGLVEIKDHKILQHGETTGHMHQFGATDPVTVFYDPAFMKSLDTRRITENERKFIVVKDGGAVLRHQEHKAFRVPAGIYEIDIVREYDYDEMDTKRVVD